MKLSEVFTQLERLADEHQTTPDQAAEAALTVFSRWMRLRQLDREWLSIMIEISIKEGRPLQELLAGQKEQSVANTDN